MDRMIRFINNGLDRLIDRMLGFKTLRTASMEDLRKISIERLIAGYKVDLEKCESCGNIDGIEYCKKMIKLLEDNLERLDD